MSKVLNNIDEKSNEKVEEFLKEMRSDMYFRSEFTSNLLSFDWLDQIEEACPYIDNIVRNPKVALIKVEEVVKVEKIRKVTVDSVKNLSKNTHYIEKINENDEVQPSKILEVRNEETFNTYENRFLFTALNDLFRFMQKKEAMLEHLETKCDKLLEYSGKTIVSGERINVELKITSNLVPESEEDDKFGKEIAEIRRRVEQIKKYISSWNQSEFVKSLKKENVRFVIPPIRKTNLILKNPNFQMTVKLWEYIRHYIDDDDDAKPSTIDSTGDDLLTSLLNHSFLMDYVVFDSISETKKEQKDKLSKYGMTLINKQIEAIISLLYGCNINISDEEIMSMISNAIKNEKEKQNQNKDEVKEKFKSEINEYLERIQDCL